MNSSSPDTGADRQPLPPFPLVRLLYSIGFAIVAWFMFWFLIVFAVVEYVLVLLQSVTGNVSGHPSGKMKRFAARMTRYLWDLFAYITFVTDAQPFPFGPFPDGTDGESAQTGS